MKSRLLALLALLSLSPGVCLAAAAAPAAPAAGNAEQLKLQAAVAKVFDTSRLHRIEITISTEDAAKLMVRGSPRVPCTFVFDGVEIKDVGVRQGGAPIRAFVAVTAKPSLSFKFNEFVKGQDLHGLNKLVMKNGLQDMSYVNEHMTYEVFRRAGYPAPMTAHAQVTINGVDSGIYTLREAVDNQFFVRNFGPGAGGGNLYEFEYGRDPIYYPMSVDLKDEVEEKRSRDDILDLAAAVSVAPPPYFVAAVGPHLDLDRFISYFALETQTSDYDSYPYNMNNSYMYRLPTTGKFVFIPHGADEAFWTGTAMVTRLTGPDQRPRSALGQAIQSVPELMQKYKNELARVSREPVWDRKALLDRVAQAHRILDTASKSGRTATDVARAREYRPIIEGFITGGGVAAGTDKLP